MRYFCCSAKPKREFLIISAFHFSVLFRSVVYLLPDRDRLGRLAQKVAGRQNTRFSAGCVRRFDRRGLTACGFSPGMSAKVAVCDHAVRNRRGRICHGDGRLQNDAAFSGNKAFAGTGPLFVFRHTYPHACPVGGFLPAVSAYDKSGCLRYGSRFGCFPRSDTRSDTRFFPVPKADGPAYESGCRKSETPIAARQCVLPRFLFLYLQMRAIGVIIDLPYNLYQKECLYL